MGKADGATQDWNDLRTFLAVYRAGGVAKAARTLGVDKATVSRRLAALEATAGERLFSRSPAGLVPTEAARRVVEAAESAELHVFRFDREVRGADQLIEGLVRVTSGELLGPLFIVPSIAAFNRSHPRVRVDVQVETRTADLTRRESDVAVRLYRPKGDALLVRRLGSHAVSLFGAGAYVRERGAPRRVADLRDHVFLSYDAELREVPEATWLREHVPDAPVVLESNSSRALLDACAAGLGLAILPNYAASFHPNLVELKLEVPVPAREIWLVTHKDTRNVGRVKALSAFLVDLFKTQALRLLAGHGAA
jgi:DNA-binding transcriptional LysR family regulator